MRVPVLAVLAALACGDAPVPIATPITKAPEAPANCYAFSGNICMTISDISVTCVDVSPGAEMTCKANVQMTIPTLITSGRVTVGVRITAKDFIFATIENVPKTPPGALSAHTRSQRFGGGCIAGVTSRAVQVYDGNYPSRKINGGRPLFVESVPTTMSCTPLIASR